MTTNRLPSATHRSACYDVPLHHRHLWEDYTTQTNEVARVAEAGEKRVGGFEDGFMPELHHRLYASSPREIAVEDRATAAAVRGKLHALASELPEFSTLRKQTVHDPLWAGIAACTLADSITRVLPERIPTPDADKAQALLDGFRTIAENTDGGEEVFAPHIAKAESDVAAANEGVLAHAESLDESAVRNALRAGIETATDAIAEAQATMTAFGWGDEICGPGAHKSAAVAHQMARKVRSSATLARIVELSGRLILSARAKRASRSEYARSEVVGVEPTGDVGRLLPSELGALADPLQTTALFRKLHERAALGYKLAGSERLAKGPIVLCLDQSYSMSEAGRDEWAKAVALAILDAARAERRAFGIVLYNGGVVRAELFPVAADADPRVLLDILSSAPSGGTSFAPALSQALAWIESAGTFKTADVIHITDGEADTCGAHDTLARAKRSNVTIRGIGIGGVSGALTAWSNETAAISDVRSDSPAVDLIFDNI